MSKRWVNRTYTYSEPVEQSEPGEQPHGITGPDTYDDPSALRAGNRTDFDAGYEAGYRAGWVAGYGVARHRYGAVNSDDLAVEGGGESHPLLL